MDYTRFGYLQADQSFEWKWDKNISQLWSRQN